ncbi:hypothetical protein ABPG77_004563 [Micractinium sp. CCAP 211/92]
MSSAKQAKEAKQTAKTATTPTLGNLHKTCYPALKQIGRELIKLESLVSYDRGDMLRDAASLAQLALMEWGLPHSAGTKSELWSRLVDEVQDSVLPPPRRCLVSAATRRELSGWSTRRVSQSKAMELYGLKQSDLDGMEYVLEQPKGGRLPGKMYLLREVKQKAQQRLQQTGVAGAAGTPAPERPHAHGRKGKGKAKKDASAAAKEAALPETLMSMPGAFRATDASYPEGALGVDAAASWLEKWGFAFSGPTDVKQLLVEELASAAGLSASLAPQASSAVNAAADLAQWRREVALHAALARWVRQQRNLQFILGNPQVPRSLLPELQRMWEEHQQRREDEAAAVAGGGLDLDD